MFAILPREKLGKKVLRRSQVNLWIAVTVAIAALIATPVIAVLSQIFTNSGDVWQHLASTVLGTYITNSLWLMLGVGCGVLLLGVTTAWLVTMCRFPGSRMFEWMLLLPLAAPAYLLAYVYTEFLEFYGPVQTGLRQIFGWQSMGDYWFPHIRSMGGAIFLLSLTLYPYVYLLARVAFLEQSIRTLEASRSLGCNPWRSFYAIALPLARPAISVGLSLALMETLNDYGTVQFFSVDTFTTGIYRTWFGMGEQAASAQLASMLTLFVLWLILLEQWSRRQARYYQTSSRYQQISTYKLQGMRAILAGSACLIPITLGFLLPTGLLVYMTATAAQSSINADFWELSKNSFLLAAVTAGLSVAIALVLAYGERLCANWKMQFAVRIAAMGYAIPGSVIAVGIMAALGGLDRAISSGLQSAFGISTGLLFSGTLVALIFAYLVRFLAVSYSAISASLGKIKPNLDDAAHSLGHGSTSTLLKVHVPMLWGGLLTAAMMVFVDVMKELPATVIIRPPFNFDTLAIRVYNYASDERLAEAAAPALAIVLVALIPVICLSWQISRRNAS
ncbi:iron ABC transporter permease [Tumidithrix helvetica PCC 7403]|uniref:ABC transporter permease n=1 Tax=Tumidithrix helvetica TaxID=3457545 RepID=UPI003CA7F1D8